MIATLYPAQYDGTINTIFIDWYGVSVDPTAGMFECTSGIGGDPESFENTDNGVLVDIIGSDEDCTEYTSGVDFTAFSCTAGHYAGLLVGDPLDSDRINYKSSASQRHYYATSDGFGVERSYTGAFAEWQFYFVNTPT